MTGNVKTLYKPNETFALVNTEECVKKKSDSGCKIYVWYIVGISFVAYLALSLISFRLSYLASDSVRELRDEVTRLKAILDHTWINEISEFEPVGVYDDYLDGGDLTEVLKQVGDGNNENDSLDVIGVLKYEEASGSTTADPESVLAKVLLKESSKRRVERSVQPAIEIELIINATDAFKLQHATIPVEKTETLTLTTATTPEAKQNKNGKLFTKRSPESKLVKVPLHVASKLVKQPEHISEFVEEFPIGTEPTTVKLDIPSKRSKGRSRHNIETLDDRTTSGKKKILPAVHYDGDSSGYVVGKHTNYNGNGHLSHPSQIYSDWVQAGWVKTMGMDEYFHLEKGLVKIKENGIYLLYVQIYYLDDHDTNGYRVYKNEEPLLQCTTMTHSIERIFKGNTCYTSRVEYLKENDVISIQDLGNSRYTIFEGGKSFFGLVKLK